MSNLAECPINGNPINNITGYIEWAYRLWYHHFVYNINKLFELHPINKLNEDGTKFWSTGKQPPTPLLAEGDAFYEYIIATTILLYRTYNLQNSVIPDDVENIIRTYDYKNINTNDMENVEQVTFHPQQFEKDNDDNYHIKYIHATSNNRATNYHIPTITFDETKGIAGKIIPALEQPRQLWLV